MQCVVLVVASVVGCCCVCSTLTLTVRERGAARVSQRSDHRGQPPTTQPLQTARAREVLSTSTTNSRVQSHWSPPKKMLRAVFMSHPRALIVKAGARI